MKIIFLIGFLLLLIGDAALAFSNDAESFKPFLDRAMFEQKAHNHKSAIKLFKKVYYRSESLKREALQGLVACLNEANRTEEAAEILADEVQNSPLIGEYRIWLAETYISLSEFQKALDESSAAEKILGQTKVVLRTRALAQQKLGKHAEAVTTLSIYLQENSKDFTALADRAESYLNLAQFGNAFADLQKAFEIRQFDERILSMYTKAAYLTHNFREVKNLGSKCIEQFPKNAFCYEYLGKSSFEMREYPKAVTSFESALELNSSNVEVRLLYAEALALSGNSAASDNQFAMILKQKPDFEPAMRSWAKLLSQRKMVEELGLALKNFSDQSPSNVWSAVELSKLLFGIGETSAALKRMKTLNKETKSNAAKFYYAYFLNLSGDSNEARDVLENVTDKSFEVDFHTGLAFMNEKKMNEAIKYWLKVPAESPAYFKARVNAALAYEKQGNFEKTKELLTVLLVPSGYRKVVGEKSIAVVEDRKPASSSPGPTFFTEWSTPQL